MNQVYESVTGHASVETIAKKYGAEMALRKDCEILWNELLASSRSLTKEKFLELVIAYRDHLFVPMMKDHMEVTNDPYANIHAGYWHNRDKCYFPIGKEFIAHVERQIGYTKNEISMRKAA